MYIQERKPPTDAQPFSNENLSNCHWVLSTDMWAIMFVPRIFVFVMPNFVSEPQSYEAMVGIGLL